VPTTEHTINDAIGDALRPTRRLWLPAGVVNSENTGALRGNNQRPDILVCEPHTSPVVIETEVLPAATVEAEARSRLGAVLRATGRPILSSIAVRLPVALRNLSGQQLRDAVASADDLELCIFTGTSPTDFERWPSLGWVRCSVGDLSRYAQSASVPPAVIEAAATQLVEGVTEAAGLLGEIATTHAGAADAIAVDLKQHDEPQTRRMAATMLANAFVFHETLAGGPGQLGEVRSVEQLRGAGEFTKANVLAEWRKILAVNYWPIFDISRRILEHIPAQHSSTLLDTMADTAERLLANQMMRSHDLTGAIFQKLISDRKFLAAYYTTPAAAALLAGLAVNVSHTPSNHDWSDENALQSLRVADFACGTGTLLSAAYQRISQLHELHGGDAEALHPSVMADVLVGCDVLPAAAHLTASMLAGAHPTTQFSQSHILTVPYGLQADSSVALGSLDLLNPQRTFDILNITAQAAEGLGEKEREMWAALPHNSFDLVLMNPPFTRPTGHEGQKVGVPNPMFAAFSSTDEEQRRMGQAMTRLTAGTNYHGNAGEAAAFLALGHRKLKAGGTLGLVMPLSLLGGDAWEASRSLLASDYGDLIAVSIAGANDDELSFSADTDMGECIVVGVKGHSAQGRAVFAVLEARPAYPMLGWNIAEELRRIRATGGMRRLEDGPVGGTRIAFGGDLIGHAIEGPLPSTGPWNLARIKDLSLAQTAYQLASASLAWLPGMPNAAAAPPIGITTVDQIGQVGPYHMDINASGANGAIRGPFDVVPVSSGSPTYPILWAHVAARERRMQFEAECEGVTKTGSNPDQTAAIATKVASLMATASNCHFNRDFRFNSQSTSMQFTSRKTIGGRAWLSIKLASEDQERALTLWSNTSLGSLLYWWHANKQQAGRGTIGKNALGSLPVLDVTQLTGAQLSECQTIFNEFVDRDLDTLHRLANDGVRADLDREFFTRVFGWDATLFVPNGPFELLRQKLGEEPSIVGGRTT
jgi:hypothetical protein